MSIDIQEVNKKILESPLASLWETIGICHHHGMALMLGSLRTKNSCGIGEYLDLLPLIDYCKTVGFDIIQLLPINDSGEDPSPYNAISSLALHPIYLSLHALPNLEKHQELSSKLKNFSYFNKTERIDYHGVLKAKSDFLKAYYEKEKHHFIKNPDFQAFVKRCDWISDYGLYKALRESMTFMTWREWPEALKNPTDQRRKELKDIHQDEIEYFAFLQYLCSLQMNEVKEYATKQKVFIKGDIPILISPDSADVWLHREFFDLGFAVGVPPDQFNEDGQYWGFPAYVWPKLKEAKYSFWKKRLESCESYYHIYRIDHVLGFYRLWLIPPGKAPGCGFYNPSDLKEAVKVGHEILQNIVEFSKMLPVAEDLGVVPPKITQSLRGLGIAGTNVIRWERDYETDEHMIALEDYEPLSMTTVSTHDSQTLQIWWEKHPDEVKEFCEVARLKYQKKLTKEMRYEILKKSHHSGSLLHINLFQEYLALFDDLVSKDKKKERINIPGFVLPANWTYRFKYSLEEIASHSQLSKSISSIIQGLPL